MARATLKTYRQSARKVRLVADLIRGLGVSEALYRLKFANKRAAGAIEKVLRSALANAKDRGQPVDGLVVSEIVVNEGPTLFRMRPRAQGRAFVIRKRTCHIKLTLAPQSEVGGQKQPVDQRQPETQTA